MISHTHKFIYSHIPKCGGTTIENTLSKYAIKTFGRNADRKWLRNKRLFDAVDEYVHYYKFSFSRNPWDRLVSCYIFFKSKFANRVKNIHSFNEFVESTNLFLKEYNSINEDYSNIKDNTCADGLDGAKINAPSSFAFLGYHVLPQTYFIKNNFDYIGRVENLQNDFNIICDKLGITRHQLPHKNKSKHKHYTEYYDNSTRQIVEKFYANDIEYFGYKFGE